MHTSLIKVRSLPFFYICGTLEKPINQLYFPDNFRLFLAVVSYLMEIKKKTKIWFSRNHTCLQLLLRKIDPKPAIKTIGQIRVDNFKQCTDNFLQYK